MDAATEGEEIYEFVVVGGGICGLATALALHRKGIAGVAVLERSESLRATGAAIGVLPNGWRALDQLGVGPQLRQNSLPLQGGWDIWIDKQNHRQQKMQFLTGEARCLKRSDLIEALANALPPGTIHFGSQIVSLKMDPQNQCTTLHTHDNTKSIRAKAVVGCDGSRSVVADFLGVKPAKVFPFCAVRGLTNYPDGHSFGHEFLRLRRNRIMLGRIPINNNLVYWFVAQPSSQFDAKEFANDPETIKRLTLEIILGFPTDLIEMIQRSDAESLSFTHLRHRAPWDILVGSFCKGPVAVAGDAMHVMGPFLGQGGSAGLEDAVVLARNLAQKIGSSVNLYEYADESEEQNVRKKIGEAFHAYVEERRMRVVRLSTQTYLVGTIAATTSPLLKFIAIVLMVIFFNDQSGHTKFNCGLL